MTDQERSALLELVIKWRSEVPNEGGQWEAGEAYTLNRCANKLSLLLLSFQPQPLPTAGVHGNLSDDDI
jgi:hypothetical protein